MQQCVAACYFNQNWHSFIMKTALLNEIISFDLLILKQKHCKGLQCGCRVMFFFGGGEAEESLVNNLPLTGTCQH
jgi:hypothetical protein